ncbi:hypothetical protein ABW20_dc0110464 [Dactylellina cionopaga]|nr:hypothetical protein ABW20_dc0110464 [Dactylellina cionopaga]
MSYIPTLTPTAEHPPGLSPPEITAMAVPYLASVESELEELRRSQSNPQAEVQVQQERDRVRSLIQRQLAHDQAFDALEAATGGKRLTRSQDDPARIWEEIDMAGVRKRASDDRKSAQSYVTMWPTFENGTSDAPPVPRVPAQLASTKPQESKIAKALKSPANLFRWGSRSEDEPVRPLQPSSRQIKDDSPVLGLYGPPQGMDMGMGMAMGSPSGGDQFNMYPPMEQNNAAYSQNYSPSKEDEVSPTEWFRPQSTNFEVMFTEKVPSPSSHVRNESTNTVSAPPPYTQGEVLAQTARKFSDISEGQESFQQTPRFPVRANELPRISTGSSNRYGAPQQLTATNLGALSQMQFTPTSPNQARTGPQTRGMSPRANIGLEDITRPGDSRDRAEKTRLRQEKRERLFKRGGSLWFCGICCGVQKMSKKLKIFWWTAFIVFVIVSTVVGTVMAVKKSNERAPVDLSQPLNLISLPNLPSMPADNVTVTPRLINRVNTCIAPSTLWSCNLPPPLAAGMNAAQPIFNWKIFALNTSADVVSPSPPLPLVAEYKNFSKIDGVLGSVPEGEPTNFYISLILPNDTTTTASPTTNEKRSHTRHFPRGNSSSIITADASIPTASIDPILQAAVLPTRYSGQQLRFFDRGLPSEHYKFVTHFDKTIYLRTVNTDFGQAAGINTLDADGGVAPSEARFVCKWPSVRYITKIFTRMDQADAEGKRKFIVDPETLAVLRTDDAGGFAGYAVQIEEDIANYIPDTPTISCFSIDERGEIDPTSEQKKVLVEGISTGKSGVDYRGCQCAWSNFKEATGRGL